MLPGLAPSVMPGYAPVDLTFVQNVNSTVAGSSKTFAADIGAANQNKVVVVAVFWAISGSTTLTSATIDGVAATVRAQCNGTNTGVAIIEAPVTTGGTVNVVCNFANSVPRSGIATYTKTGGNGALADFDNPAGGSAANRTATLDIPANGAALAAATGDSAYGGVWSGATSDFSYTDANDGRGGATKETSTALANQAITANSVRVVCAVSWS